MAMSVEVVATATGKAVLDAMPFLVYVPAILAGPERAVL